MTKSRNNKRTAAPKASPTKIAISQPDHAIALLRNFLNNGQSSVSSYSVPRSKARWYSARQIADWYLTNANQYVHTGWLGRALYAANKAGMKGVTLNTVKTDTATITVYR